MTQADPYTICPLCHNPLLKHYLTTSKGCATFVEGTTTSHYALTPVEDRIVQIVILPPYTIASVLGDSKSKIYSYPNFHNKCIMEIPIVSYQDLENSEKLVKRIKNLIIFS